MIHWPVVAFKAQAFSVRKLTCRAKRWFTHDCTVPHVRFHWNVTIVYHIKSQFKDAYFDSYCKGLLHGPVMIFMGVLSGIIQGPVDRTGNYYVLLQCISLPVTFGVCFRPGFRSPQHTTVSYPSKYSLCVDHFYPCSVHITLALAPRPGEHQETHDKELYTL